ncbi:single-stranded DNA-binding protein [Neobacillus rhizophilus]|uniref:Single-stranded DNA-binding protein n=1 Tax=Neobacillus rhizophilus TaxID=2833579 RepID=A0A942U5B1_9BACI|nr:single-stranded DNA-binding protein [Neobacillus rhizophilus]MBS4212658.1 single-stranded DNA-binding protein [Neobacillus rhizophilus]
MINQVTLVGRLTRDPELNQTTEGTPVSHITLAVNRNFRNHNGEFDTDFVQCTLWRNAAENTYKYCRKGAVVGITGRLQTRHYDGRDGKRVYVTEVVAETIRFLSTKPQGAGAESRSGSSASVSGAAPGQGMNPPGQSSSVASGSSVSGQSQASAPGPAPTAESVAASLPF